MNMTSGGSFLGKLATDLRQPRVVNGLLISSRMRLLRDCSTVKKLKGYRMLKILMPRVRLLVEMLYDYGDWNKM